MASVLLEFIETCSIHHAKEYKNYPASASEIPNLTWEDILAFSENREFDYWVTVKQDDETKLMEDILYSIKDDSIQIFYDKDTNCVDVASEKCLSKSSSLNSSFSSTSSELTPSESGRLADVELYTDDKSSSLNSSFSSTSSDLTSPESGRLADVELYTDDKTKNLFAVCNSNANVRYNSHCLEKGKERRLEPNVPVEIFDFGNLFETLTSEAFINFDPSEATLSFENNLGTKSFVTLTSKAASGLFESLTN